MEDIKTREEFIELRARGYSFDKIAGKLHLAKQTLIDWSKEFEEEIANLKAVELEALYEKYFLLKEKRLQTFGELLKRIKTELDKRKLKDIPTDKLLELLARYGALVKEDYIEPRFQTSEEIAEAREDKRTLGELTNTAPARYGKLKVA